ncbi:MAG: tail fiber protein [Betaproteobacteria bacterium]
MSDPFVAEIRMFGGNFAPTGWAKCNGQLLPLSQNTALFSLLGTMYGGNGQSTFALPNLEGATPIGTGQGAGLSERFQGEESGTEFVTLLATEMPLHNHFLRGNFNTADVNDPSPARTLARSSPGSLYQSNTASNLTSMNVSGTTVTGGSLPHNNMQPFLVVNFIIAMQGVFPARP